MRLPPVIFREIAFHYAELNSAGILHLFSDDGSAPTSSIAGRTEHDLIRFLITDTAARGLLCETLELSPDAFLKAAVQQPFYAPREGDIDLLAWNRQSPHEAVALEVKRLKIIVEDEGHDSINRLDAVGEGVRQAKRLHAKFSFHRIYFAILSAVDAASRKSLNIPSRGITSESVPNRDPSTPTFRRILHFPRREELPAEIGILLIELVQPTGRNFSDLGLIRISVHHKATPRDQRITETRKLEELMQAGK